MPDQYNQNESMPARAYPEKSYDPIFSEFIKYMISLINYHSDQLNF